MIVDTMSRPLLGDVEHLVEFVGSQEPASIYSGITGAWGGSSLAARAILSRLLAEQNQSVSPADLLVGHDQIAHAHPGFVSSLSHASRTGLVMAGLAVAGPDCRGIGVDVESTIRHIHPNLIHSDETALRRLDLDSPEIMAFSLRESAKKAYYLATGKNIGIRQFTHSQISRRDDGDIVCLVSPRNDYASEVMMIAVGRELGDHVISVARLIHI
jgi:4'-phosphopantetheinyl transferase EntD